MHAAEHEAGRVGEGLNFDMKTLLAHNIPQYKQHKYYGEKISGYEINLKVDEVAHVFQACEISDCIVRLDCDSRVANNVLTQNIWKNCMLMPNKEMSLATIDADFAGCKFEGSWSLRFGGSVDSCDFTNADLVFGAFYKNEKIEENKISGKSTVIIEDLKSKYSDIKQRLSGKTRLGMHIRPNMTMVAFNIEKQKDSDVIRALLKDYI